MLILLLFEAGDMERNTGPNTINNSLSILHCNIRSIRNKLDYITKNLLDFDILCFSESHLDANISTESLIKTSKYDIPYRKDRTNHGGDESLWVEIKVNRDIYVIGLFIVHGLQTPFSSILSTKIQKRL